MKILIEKSEDSKSKVVLEQPQDKSQKPSKRYIIEGTFIQTNVKNRNGRVYPKEIVKADVDRYIREQIMTNRAVGELNHPLQNPEINYERVSHKIEKLEERGDNFWGRAVITKGTPMGAIVAGLMDEGVQLGVSTRAVGSTRLCEGGVKVVQKDFYLITASDIVSDPSAPDAFVTNLMEGKEWVWENGLLVQKDLEQLVEEVEKSAKAKRLDEKKLIEIFNKVLNGKNSKS